MTGVNITIRENGAFKFCKSKVPKFAKQAQNNKFCEQKIYLGVKVISKFCWQRVNYFLAINVEAIQIFGWNSLSKNLI